MLTASLLKLIFILAVLRIEFKRLFWERFTALSPPFLEVPQLSPAAFLPARLILSDAAALAIGAVPPSSSHFRLHRTSSLL